MPRKDTLKSFLEKVLLIHGNRYDYTESIYVNCRTRIKIVCKLHGEFMQLPKDHLSGFGCTKCGRLATSEKLLGVHRPDLRGRDERVAAQGPNNAKETRAQQFIKSFLPPNEYHLTPEFCSADAAYGQLGEKCLPIQVKSASRYNNLYMFHNVQKYPTMIIICVPLVTDSPTESLEFLVVCGSGLPLHIGYNPKGKWSKYIIRGRDLPNVLKQIKNCVINDVVEMTLPNGTTLDLANVRLEHFENLAMPTYHLHAFSQTQSNIRQQKFPDFQYRYPDVQHSTVDIIINGVEIQDKCAYDIENGKSLKIVLTKSAGHTEGHRIKSPYDSNDFMALWIHVPHEKFYFIVPMKILINKCIVRSQLIPGSSSLTFGKNCSHWIHDFKFLEGEEDEQLKVQSRLQESIHSLSFS